MGGGAAARTLGVTLACALALGCSPPPVRTPQRLADRGLAPLARTVEVRSGLELHFERRPPPLEVQPSFTVGGESLAIQPSHGLTYAFSDAFASTFPLALLWSPVADINAGTWLTVGGGIYGIGVFRSHLLLDDAVGLWGKRRIGQHFWLTAGVVPFHTYRGSQRQSSDTRRGHRLTLLLGAEAGVQLGDTWSVALLADHGHDLLFGRARRSRLAGTLVCVPAFWMDIGLRAEAFLHRYEGWHVDPVATLLLSSRW